MDYRGFTIQKAKYINSKRSSCYYIFKDGEIYSFMALISIDAGITVIDTYLKSKPCI